jgi:DUF2917 family protein
MRLAGGAAVVKSIDLARGGIISLRGAAGHTVHARKGTLWVTEERATDDVMLQRGQSFRLSGTGLTVVEAFSDASLTISAD